MFRIVRAAEASGEFLRLNEELEKEYYEQFGEITLRYRAYNGLGEVTDFFTAYEGSMPAGIACIRPLGGAGAELKRVYVRRCSVAGDWRARWSSPPNGSRANGDCSAWNWRRAKATPGRSLCTSGRAIGGSKILNDFRATSFASVW